MKLINTFPTIRVLKLSLIQIILSYFMSKIFRKFVFFTEGKDSKSDATLGPFLLLM